MIARVRILCLLYLPKSIFDQDRLDKWMVFLYFVLSDYDSAMHMIIIFLLRLVFSCTSASILYLHSTLYPDFY